MPCEEGFVLCYNKGCGKTFDPQNNKSDSCIFHSGVPVFHDAYKGWSCCKKKCTDFTEFLNIKGCTTSYHSNIKPEEPQKPAVDKSKASEVIEYKAPKPIVETTVQRPSFDSPMTKIVPVVSDALRQQVASYKQDGNESEDARSLSCIPIGTACKNKACKVVYEGPATLQTPCVHHPGCAVFHEGMKFWSCCTKRTTDFNAFLEQVGCQTGEHVWFKPKGGNSVECRLDWHQTSSAVYVSLFAKRYDPEQSYVQLSPVRIKISLFFPENGSYYINDLELRGVVKVEDSSVQMLPTKVEVKLKKTSGASWSTLDIPRAAPKASSQPQTELQITDSTLAEQVDAVDLSNL